MSASLKELHDDLLAKQPADATHDRAQCPFCTLDALSASKETTTHADPEGGSPVSDDTFTQEQLDAKIAEATAAATAELQTQLETLQAQAKETEVGKAVAEAVEAKDTEIADLAAKLEAAEAAKTAAETLATETHDFFAEAIEAQEAFFALETRKVERRAKLEETKAFDEKYLDDNIDRYAAMSDEDFELRLTEIAAMKPASAGGLEAKLGDIPALTAMAGDRGGDAGSGSNDGSALAALPLLRRGALGDPRTL